MGIGHLQSRVCRFHPDRGRAGRSIWPTTSVFDRHHTVHLGLSDLCSRPECNSVDLRAGRRRIGRSSPASRSTLHLDSNLPEPGERARAIAIWGGFNGLAMAVGPTVGGLLVDYFGWRSIFYLVVPFGAVALVLAFTSVSESASPEGRRLDLSGQALSILALGLLAFSFIQASPARMVLSTDIRLRSLDRLSVSQRC
jgi:hypothetical protein